MKYVALLRGINVGGNNKINMGQLKAALEANGFNEVSTYINSGNIFFSDGIEAASVLTHKFEAVVKNTFNLGIKVLVVDEKTIAAITKAIPDDWVNDTITRTDVMFYGMKLTKKL